MQTGSRSRRLWLSAASLALAASAALLVAAPAEAASPVRPAVTTSGVHFVDRAGRIVILHGVDISYRSALVEKVIELRANFARVRVLWADVEPRRNQFDAGELKRLDALVAYLTAHRVNVELDLRGRTLPAWVNIHGFHAHHAPAPCGAYLVFVRKIVRRYAGDPRVIGFGIFNEPKPALWNHVGSPQVDQQMLAWQAEVRDAILALDPYTDRLLQRPRWGPRRPRLLPLRGVPRRPHRARLAQLLQRLLRARPRCRRRQLDPELVGDPQPAQHPLPRHRAQPVAEPRHPLA